MMIEEIAIMALSATLKCKLLLLFPARSGLRCEYDIR